MVIGARPAAKVSERDLPPAPREKLTGASHGPPCLHACLAARNTSRFTACVYPSTVNALQHSERCLWPAWVCTPSSRWHSWWRAARAGASTQRTAQRRAAALLRHDFGSIRPRPHFDGPCTYFWSGLTLDRFCYDNGQRSDRKNVAWSDLVTPHGSCKSVSWCGSYTGSASQLALRHGVQAKESWSHP